ncbi:YdbH domain-containing protein [Parvularcula sp. LCG005]|uniref:intermembrane phospholipid transport protein YdbH family protein n=1 Tax=Parvularcula sp. LCG005 TaxID=3078805 RepID=UPI002943C77B|nr:YdbH domain-containing protein [Parvularcula sp. LCG005]WOI52501.1 YdbH domain-containing protein [Parvularcula sp. LCG005]
MKIGVTIFLVLLAIVAILAGSAYLARGKILAEIIEDQMADVGVDTPQVDVGRLGPRGLTLKLTGGTGPEAFTADIIVSYDIEEAVKERRVDDIVISRAQMTARLSPEGRLTIGGFTWSGGDGEDTLPPTSLPLDALRIERVDVRLLTPEGEAEMIAKGELLQDITGTFEVSGKTARAGLERLQLVDTALKGSADLRPDGSVAFLLDGETGLRRTDLAIDDIALDGELVLNNVLRSDADVTAAARLELQSADVSLSASPLLAPLTSSLAAVGATPSVLNFSGSVSADAADGRLSVTLGNTGLVVTDGAELALRLLPASAGPFLTSDGDNTAIAGAVTFTTPPASGHLSGEVAMGPGQPITFTAEGRLDRLTVGPGQTGAVSVSASGNLLGDTLALNADLGMEGLDARAGTYRFRAARLDAPLLISGDLAAGTYTVGTLPGRCLTVPRLLADGAEGRVATIQTIRLCPAGEAPIFTYSVNDAPVYRTSSSLSMGTVSLAGGTEAIARNISLGTQLTGPVGEQPARVTATLRGGVARYGDIVEISAVRGDAALDLQTEGVVGQINLRQVDIADAQETPRFNPISVTGPVRLKSDLIDVALDVKTASAMPLGRITGQHDLSTGGGQGAFATGALTFAPGGLQPAGIVPALRGIVSGATGGVDARVELDWTGDELKSGANIVLNGVSFRGPGVVVKETRGLTGTLNLSSLAPITSDGEQRLTLDRIDLGAVKFDGGRIRLTVPGDDTVTVHEAVFPWLGGEISASDTHIAFDGTTDALLTAKDVSIAEALALLNVPGLSGEGAVAGQLPLRIDDFEIRLVNGRLASTGPGVIRYKGQAAAAGQANDSAKLAFDVLEELHFKTFAADINGRLDGDLDFAFEFEGSSEVTPSDRRVKQAVTAPVILRARIEVPLLTLIDQARLSTDYRLQLERAREQAKASATTE